MRKPTSINFVVGKSAFKIKPQRKPNTGNGIGHVIIHQTISFTLVKTSRKSSKNLLEF